MDIIPVKYSSTAKSLNYTTNVFGLVRDWMLLHDYKRYYNDVSYNWSITDPASEGMDLITDLLSTEQYAELFSLFRDDSIDFEAWEAE